MSSAMMSAPELDWLRPSPRLPVLFLGHGSPMNAITDNPWRRSWQALGEQLRRSWPDPQMILCISAHWLTEGWWITAMDRPRTIHDFGGFPQELFDQQYPAPGAPEAAREISLRVRQRASQALGLDTRWGLDHGAWAVLKPMFAEADIPVLQLSMDYSRAPEEHVALARQLRDLRERGVLIVASGNLVHNLRMMDRQAPSDQAYDWALEFDEILAGWIAQGQLERLSGFLKLGSLAQMAHPTHEHLLPLLYAAAAVHPGEAPHLFNADYQGLSIAMRSVIWGQA